jgi:predicted nucleic acid-binding Zn ribbon protein
MNNVHSVVPGVLAGFAVGWQEVLILLVGGVLIAGVVLLVLLLCRPNRGSQAAPTLPPAVPFRTCENCGRAIGNLEKVCSYRGRAVCWECDQRLRAQDAMDGQPKP